MGGMARKAMHLARKEAQPPAPARKLDRRAQPGIEAGNRDRSQPTARQRWTNSEDLIAGEISPPAG
jgi:hypothetical protein